MAKKTMTLEHIDYSISRWKTRLKRAMTAIDKLEKQRKRLVKAQTDPKPVRAWSPDRQTFVKQPEPQQTGEGDMVIKKVEPTPPKVEDDIPSFLRRTPDPVAEQIKSQQAETKQLKARGRIAKMKAKQAGDLKKMPLTGKAALAAIRG
jgi:hypothetical protein